MDKAWHPPIRYFMAPLGNADQNDKVKDLLDFILDNDAKAMFRQAGFQVETD